MMNEVPNTVFMDHVERRVIIESRISIINRCAIREIFLSVAISSNIPMQTEATTLSKTRIHHMLNEYY